jgi:hypothetical protein
MVSRSLPAVRSIPKPRNFPKSNYFCVSFQVAPLRRLDFGETLSKTEAEAGIARRVRIAPVTAQSIEMLVFFIKFRQLFLAKSG